MNKHSISHVHTRTCDTFWGRATRNRARKFLRCRLLSRSHRQSSRNKKLSAVEMDGRSWPRVRAMLYDEPEVFSGGFTSRTFFKLSELSARLLKHASNRLTLSRLVQDCCSSFSPQKVRLSSSLFLPVLAQYFFASAIPDESSGCASVRQSSRHTQSSSHLRSPAPTPAAPICFIDFTTRITMRIFPRREYEPTVKYEAASHCVGVSHRRETCFLNSVSSNFTRTKIQKVSAQKKESKEK